MTPRSQAALVMRSCAADTGETTLEMRFLRALRLVAAGSARGVLLRELLFPVRWHSEALAVSSVIYRDMP